MIVFIYRETCTCTHAHICYYIFYDYVNIYKCSYILINIFVCVQQNVSVCVGVRLKQVYLSLPPFAMFGRQEIYLISLASLIIYDIEAYVLQQTAIWLQLLIFFFCVHTFCHVVLQRSFNLAHMAWEFANATQQKLQRCQCASPCTLALLPWP